MGGFLFGMKRHSVSPQSRITRFSSNYRVWMCTVISKQLQYCCIKCTNNIISYHIIIIMSYHKKSYHMISNQNISHFYISLTPGGTLPTNQPPDSPIQRPLCRYVRSKRHRSVRDSAADSTPRQGHWRVLGWGCIGCILGWNCWCIRLNRSRIILRKHVCEIEECPNIYMMQVFVCSILLTLWYWPPICQILRTSNKRETETWWVHTTEIGGVHSTDMIISLLWRHTLSYIPNEGDCKQAGMLYWTKTNVFCNYIIKAYQTRLMTHR